MNGERRDGWAGQDETDIHFACVRGTRQPMTCRSRLSPNLPCVYPQLFRFRSQGDLGETFRSNPFCKGSLDLSGGDAEISSRRADRLV
jgi:hypothetical protein